MDMWEDTKTMCVGAYGPISIIAIIVSVYNLKNKIKFDYQLIQKLHDYHKNLTFTPG